MRKFTIGLAAVALAALGACGGESVDRRSSGDASDAPRDSEGRELAITSVGSIDGTRWLYAAYGVPDVGKFASYSKPSRQRNALLIDRETGETLQLLPDNDSFIHDVWFVRAEKGPLYTREGYRSGETESDAPPAFVMLETEVVTDETSERVLLVGSMEALELVPIASGFDRIEHMEMLDASRLSLLIEGGGQYRLLVVDMDKREVLSTGKVEPRPVG